MLILVFVPGPGRISLLESRSDLVTVAVGFSPRRGLEGFHVA
jgi:hypothetical protein